MTSSHYTAFSKRIATLFVDMAILLWLVACAGLPVSLPDISLPTDSGQNQAQATPGASTQRNAVVRPPLTGQLVYSSEQNGRWDLWITTPDGSAAQQLTNDGSSRAPATTRDGTRLAFESHRDGNWEIYSTDWTGSIKRLTRGNAYDGRPCWSPDGTRLAFASNRDDDLDIWLMNADGTDPRDITKDSPAVDDAPAWSPDGRWIAFTSRRTGVAQVWIVSADGRESVNLSQNKFDEQSPAWSPDGKQIAFVSDRDGQRAIYVAEFSTSGLKNPRRLTFSGWDELPAWSPDAKYIAFTSPRPTRQPIYLVPINGGIPAAADIKTQVTHSLTWTNSNRQISATRSSAENVDDPPSEASPAKLVPLKDVYLAPSWGQMSDRVSVSYLALRSRVKTDAGWDFLGVLSDMTRQLNSECGDGCENLSWHKAGRAVDTRMEVASGGAEMLEIVREDQLGETYWRIYLRTTKQDGTMGEPLVDPPWDWTYDARWKVSSGQGGIQKPIPSGYYVDFTELAREYGWTRISSYDDPYLSWKENIMGMEFWHYQNTDGFEWYKALEELYTDKTLGAAFDWNKLLRQKEDPYLLRLKAIPAPASAWKWFALSP